MTWRAALRWVVRFGQDWYLTLSVLTLAMVMSWALHVNYDQTRRLDDLVKDARARELDTAYLDCQSRAVGRSGIRSLILIITDGTTTLPPERVALYRALLDQLPPIVCPDPSQRASISPEGTAAP